MAEQRYARPGLDELYPWTPEKCRDCAAEVVWCRTPKGARMPLNAEESNNGNVLLMSPSEPVQGRLGILAVTLSGDVLERARSELARLYTSHHVNCPNAKNRRKPKP